MGIHDRATWEGEAPAESRLAGRLALPRRMFAHGHLVTPQFPVARPVRSGSGPGHGRAAGAAFPRSLAVEAGAGKLWGAPGAPAPRPRS